jgi:hypothetical protein
MVKMLKVSDYFRREFAAKNQIGKWIRPEANNEGLLFVEKFHRKESYPLTL